MRENKPSIGEDDIYMRRCIELARRAKGHTAPNPMVGAVLVYDGRIIGEGWHRRYGGDHAEVDCLKNVAEPDRHLISESVMYVNLEPCAHFGLTPPCAVRLVEEKVKKVVIGNVDPFDKVQGRGAEILKAGGVEVITGLLEKEGLWLNRRFFCFHQSRRPYIVLKWAQTLDGFMAPPDKSRLQITGNAASQLVHKWRTEEPAIMVGTHTALNDNPQLTARLWQGKQPLRIVPDRNLKLPRHHHLFNTDATTWVINELEESEYDNIRHLKTDFSESILPALLQRLYEAKKLSLIVEGGAMLLNSFIQAGLWDEARILTGNITLGGGIAAPVITNGAHAFSDRLENDSLQVFVNKNTAYPYVRGMAL